MAKASDNAFPSILIAEGTEPSAPAAGKQRLYIDSTTHKLKRTDSSGVDVVVEGSGNIATDAIWDVAGDIVVGTGADAAARLAIGASGKVPISNGTTLGYGYPPGYEFDYVQITSPVTTTSSADAITGNAVTYDGSTRVLIEVVAPYLDMGAAGGSAQLNLYEGATDLGTLCFIYGTSGQHAAPCYGARFLTPTAAAHTYKIKLVHANTASTVTVQAGAGGTGNYMPAWMRITKA